jgi:methylated-DNA-[protein]-cysteine S-methyltransferase
VNDPTRFHATIATPLGTMAATFSGPALTSLVFVDAPATLAGSPSGAAAASLAALHAALDDYFAGRGARFDIPLAPAGTAFQQAVWKALRDIPYGATASYGEIARRIGRPRAVRAVGAANARNPIAIIVPCHRVIGADGTLTGYAGGLSRKRALLALESGVR